MINWKALLLHCFVIFIAVLAAVRLFVPSEKGSQSEQIQAITQQLKALETHVSKIESSLAGSGKTVAQMSSFKEIDQNLEDIRNSLNRLESREFPVARQSPVSPQTPRTPTASSMQPPPPNNPANWLNELSPEKRAAVQDIFSRHAETLKSRLPAGGTLPDPQTMKQIMSESDQELKENLRSVLSESEYRKFIDSLPKSPRTASLSE